MEVENSQSEPLSAERQSFLKLTRELAGLPAEQSLAVLETAAAISGISLRASIEYLRAAPAAAEILRAGEMRSWGEMGRRLAMSDVENSISFFTEGVAHLQEVHEDVRPAVFQLCSRQITLSTSTALDTLRNVHELYSSIGNNETLESVLEVASEISRRSAKHSAEFLAKTPEVVACLNRFNDAEVLHKGIELAKEFASRAGGIAADAWGSLPSTLTRLSSTDSVRLLDETVKFLERGGGSALQVLITGGEILRSLPEIFDEWVRLLWTVAAHGNASLVAFVRSGPRFVQTLAHEPNRDRLIDLATRVIKLTREIAETDGEAALACFRSSALALRTVTMEQFEQWAREGLASHRTDSRARRSYFALETRGSHDALHSGSAGVPLESVQHLLQLYIEGLTGNEIEIAPLAAVPLESRIADGRTIHLPALVAEFGDDDLDFRLYKVLAAHAAGQIEFGTYDRDTPELRAAYASMADTYSPENVEALDAFAIADELLGQTPSAAGNSTESDGKHRTSNPVDVDHAGVLQLFPQPHLARRIFGTLENYRIDRRLRQTYRGLARDLDLIREHLRRGRPSILDLPAAMLPFELLFQTTLLGGALDDSRQFYGQIVSELETVATEYFANPSSYCSR